MQADPKLLGPVAIDGKDGLRSTDVISWQSLVSTVVSITGFVALCVAFEWASQGHGGSFAGASLWRPAAGFSIYLLLRRGLRYWPVVFLSLAAVEIGISDSLPHVYALTAAALSTAAYVGVARLLRDLRSFDSMHDLAAFARAVVPAAILLAAAHASLRALAGTGGANEMSMVVLQTALAQLNGMIILAAALLELTAVGGQRFSSSRSQFAEAMIQALAIGLALWIVFSLADAYGVRFFSLLFLPLLWVAARWGLRGATLALVVIQFGLVLAVLAAPPPTANFVQLQVLATALATVGLVLGVFVTQRRQVERRLHEKQRALNHAMQLAAVGEMTSGVTHELSQPIAALSRYLGACELLAQPPISDADLLRETLRKASSEAARTSEVLAHLREFYRTGAVEVAPVSSRSIVEGAVSSVRQRARDVGVHIEIDVTEPPPCLTVDAVQVETALQNLLNNSIDALMDWHSDRCIAVRAEFNSRGAVLTVLDSGPGLAADIRARLFEPFNTTKSRGMGMGLSLSRSLIRANGGELQFDANNTWTCFVIHLPLAQEGFE